MKVNINLFKKTIDSINWHKNDRCYKCGTSLEDYNLTEAEFLNCDTLRYYIKCNKCKESYNHQTSIVVKYYKNLIGNLKDRIIYED